MGDRTLLDRTLRDDLAIAALPLVWEARRRTASSQYLSGEAIRRESAAEAYAMADALLAARSGQDEAIAPAA